MSKVKQSIIMGALIGSAGVFITKIIGMIYVIPFNAIVGEENMAFYSYAYRTYSYILNVSNAGFPFAIATIVAKYMIKEDYDTVVAVRKISFYVMSIMGALCMFGLILVSLPLAKIVSPQSADLTYIKIVQNCYIIIASALLFVPILGVFRGFYQGLKELTIYASSQIVEQLARVTFLLICGGLAVYVFKTDRIVAIYFAVLSASVAAIVAIGQFIIKDRVIFKEIKAKTSRKIQRVEYKRILNEIIRYAMPFMVVSILGYSYFIIDMLLFNRVMGWRNEISSDLIYGIINMNVDKLTSIPMAIAPGFSVAIIPYVTACFVKGDKTGAAKNSIDCILMCIFLALPLSLVLFGLAKPIYYVMYGGTYANLGGEILSWYSLDGLTSTIAPVFTSLMMALNLRKDNIRNVATGILVKLITVVPFIYFLGYPGACLSSVLGTCISMFLNYYRISHHVDLSLKRIALITSKIFICLFCTQLTFIILQAVGLKIVDQGRFVALIQLAIVGIAGALVYFGVAFYLNIPQVILHKNTNSFKLMLKSKIGR